MNVKTICNKIKKNKWLNGYYDMKDGDVLAMVTDKEYLDSITHRASVKRLFSDLKNFNGIFKHKNIIFANHWNYGCFIYRIENNKLRQFEHLTIGAYQEEEFQSDIDKMVSGEWFK